MGEMVSGHASELQGWWGVGCCILFPGTGTKLGPNRDQMGPKWDQNGTKMGPKWDQNGTKMGPKWDQNGTKMGPKWDQNGTNMGPTWDQHGTNMGPTWDQNGTKMGPNIGSNMGPTWDQTGTWDAPIIPRSPSLFPDHSLRVLILEFQGAHYTVLAKFRATPYQPHSYCCKIKSFDILEPIFAFYARENCPI